MCSSSSSRRRRAAAAAAAVLMGHLLELFGADLTQMSGPWASAATSAAKGTNLKERLPRFSHTKGRRLPASRSLGPPHQARLPCSAPKFRPSDALRTHGDDVRTGFAAAAPLTPRHKPGAVG